MFIIAFTLHFLIPDPTNHYFIKETPKSIELSNNYLKLIIERNTHRMYLASINERRYPDIISLEIPPDAPHVLSNGYLIDKDGHIAGGVSFMLMKDGLEYKHKFTIDSIGIYCEVTVGDIKTGELENSLQYKLTGLRNYKYTILGSSPPLRTVSTRTKTFTYRNSYYIPIISMSNPANKTGISIIANPALDKPLLSYTVTDQNVIATLGHFGLTYPRTFTVGFYIVPNQADWRSGLQYLFTMHPRYFTYAANKSRIKGEWFYLPPPALTGSRMDEIRKDNVKWIELHNYFPYYGLYAPDREDWGSIIDMDRISLQAWEEGAGEKRFSYQQMNDQIEMWHKRQIMAYIYFQPFESWYQYSDRYYPGDISKDSSGNNLPAWQFCKLMNPDPTGPWGRHIIDQANKILEKYPAIDGIFYDRMDYCYYDFAHDDGLSLVNGKSVYMLGFALEKMNDTLFKIFHDRGKSIIGNCPTSLEACKDLDAIMTEGSLSNLYKIQYLGLARPIVYLPYDKTPDETEEKLKNCLLCGAFPAVTYGDSTCHKLDHRYWLLFDILKGRTWVLSPNPITVSDKYQANIFRLPGGDYAAVVISPEKSQLYDAYEYNMPVTLDLPDAKAITRAYLISGDWPGVKELKFTKKNTRINLVIPYHLTNSMVILTKGKSYQVTGASLEPTAALEDISLTPPKDIFIRSSEFEKVKIIVTNNTDRKQTLRFTSESLRDNGQILIPKTLILSAYETKILDAQIKAAEGGSYRIIARSGQNTFVREFSVKTGLTSASNALFRDDFSRSMEKWKVDRGKWIAVAGIVEGSGPSHFAYVLNNAWSSYQYQVTTRIKGSDDPVVDWLKAYIFFRIQDARNFYRFGIHGDAGVIDLFKCVNGQWFQLASANFIPLPETWYTLLIIVRGDAITGYINGKKIIEARDSTFPAGGIGIGVLEDAMRTQYRDIIVRQSD